MLPTLQEWPRTPFVREPTPLIRAPNLAQLFGRAPADVLLKMDAESGFGLGGNKARELEFELAPDHLEEATHVITCGGSPRVEVRARAQR
jgi:1-aminocyclopropane-1-carboxylate deaminase/D-cysteine desulfhydrase-like pyridoxal-dependent ACC family enzyme